MVRIDVLLPLSVAGTYTYIVPDEMPCPQPGMRVLVPLGKKSVTGIMYQFSTSQTDTPYRLREILAVLDSTPTVLATQMQLWTWISEYYMCHLGEVLAAALPAGIIDDDYTARTATYLCIANQVNDLQAVEHVLARAPKQLHVWQTLCQLTQQQPRVERRLLIEQSGESTAIVRALVEKGFIDEIEEKVSRIAPYTKPLEPPYPLSEAQQAALNQIYQSWQHHEVTLLHGVTASGKTEVYIHLIKQLLQQGKSVLYLVPEIALTTQLTDRLQRVLGDQMVVYHSRFTSAERVEIYQSILQDNNPKVVIGARSAVFLPLQQLGLVIVDEEHESSYKQQDPAPRYHARATAVMLAHYHHAKVLLGTATPSIETYYNTQSGKFGLVSLTTRFSGVSLPKITVIDLNLQYHRKEMYGHFADPLVDKIRQQLALGKQVILFQNRRGYAPMLQCSSCGKTPRCVQCDVPLTLHMQQRVLRCHYCGYSTPIPSVCNDCGAQMKVHGFDTERLEDEVAKLFPDARVQRMDLDTTRSKTAYQQIIQSFSRHEIDILIGTQMVTKGLHFDDVSLVAVLQAEQLWNQPDFRSYERAFYMLSQVAGRAGRREQQGEVVIQTFEPKSPILGYVCRHDYNGLYRSQIEERQLFGYPPFHRLLRIWIKHHQLVRVEAAVVQLHQKLQSVFGQRVSEIIIPPVSRIQNQHLRCLTLRIEVGASVAKAKELLQHQITATTALPSCKGTTIWVDVDPV